jgi:hypothetical protein
LTTCPAFEKAIFQRPRPKWLGGAVVDIRMPPTHTEEGLRAAVERRRRYPGFGVLLFSQYVETRFVN